MRNHVLCRVFGLVCLVTGWAATSAESHDLSHSQSTIVIRGREAHVEVQVDLVGFGGLQWTGRDVVGYDELDTRIEQIFGLLKDHLRVSASAPPTSSALSRYELVDNHVLKADLLLTFQRDIDALVIESTLDRITSADHQHLTIVTVGGTTTEALLTANAAVARFEGTGARWSTVWNMARAGAFRVLKGADNLLFLLLLMLSRPTVRSLALALAAAVAAQCLGVILTTLNLVAFSPGWLTAIIPLILAGMALANLLGGHPLDRALMVLALALIQTLAQADALRAMAMPAGRLALALTGFCVGATAAQAAVVAVLFPLSRITVAGQRYLRPAVSIAVVGVALYWIVQRSFPS